VKKFLDHSTRGIPRLQFNIADVRDVAKAHVLAMTSESAPGNRIIVNTDAIWMRDISKIVKKEFSSQGN
jgi:dihydroflavonol-4-reductase